jgi:hypothetical protein
MGKMNRQREKTNEQKAREFQKLREIEEIRAKERQANNARQNNPNIKNKENFPDSSNGQSRDIAAEKIGISGKTAEKAAEVIQIADALSAAGETEKAKQNIRKQKSC